MFGLFNNKTAVTFIDKSWNIIKSDVKVNSIPRATELIYLGEGHDYYKVSNVIHWPNKNSGIFIVIESISAYEDRLNNITKKYTEDEN